MSIHFDLLEVEEMKRNNSLHISKKTQKSVLRVYATLVSILVMLIGVAIVVVIIQGKQTHRSQAAPSAELLTDRTKLSYTSNNYTSEYHLYAAGLDWSKPVGMMIYADGTGESGLNDPTGSWLMGGANGIIAIAKKNNMVLLTPFSPNKSCSCWYEGDGAGYVKWLEALVTSVESQYGIDKKRIAFGGYSSGATLATRYWVPSGAAQRTMVDGVIVAISEGGTPSVSESAYDANFKANIHMNWNIGDGDDALNDVKEGQAHYAQAGMQTSLDILPGVTHDREGFGLIMDALIAKHVPALIGTPISAAPGVPSPAFCGGSTNCVPSVVISPAPTNAMSNPTIGPITTSVSPDQNISQIPIEDPTDLIPDNGNDNNNGENKGIIDILLEFLTLILEFFLSLFK